MSSRTRSDFGSLGDRISGRGVVDDDSGDRIAARHVWLDDSPGLLIRWRRDGANWSGLVVHLSETTGEPVAQWFPATHITPA